MSALGRPADAVGIAPAFQDVAGSMQRPSSEVAMDIMRR